MARVNITTSELAEVAAKLSSCAATMKEISSQIRNKTHSMETWSDARAQQFIQQCDMVSKSLDFNIDNFVKMSACLKKYAERQESADSQMKRNINSIR